MLKRFEGKVIAVAGGSGGIGSSVSKRLASEGAGVLVGDIDFAAAQQTAVEIAEAGGIATPMTLDISDEGSVQHFVAASTQLYGGLDGFHVNALDSSHAAGDTDAVAMDMADYDAMTAVNMRGYFLCTRYAVPALLARGGGAMLFTSSGSAYAGLDSRPTYSMIKSGIHALARHVASRWGKQGVRSNVIAPGLIMHPAAEAAVGAEYGEKVLQTLRVTRLGRPEDIAAVAALLMSEDGAFITGQVISVDGGASMRP